MEDLGQLLTLCIIHLVAVASPGPDFVIVLKNSLRGGSSRGFLTALGITLGNVFHLVLAVSLTSTILYKAPWFFEIMKILGGLFLFFLGYKSLRGFKSSQITPMETSTVTETSMTSPFFAGLICCVLNAKAGLYYFSLFTQYLSNDQEILKSALTLSICFLAITFSWFFGISLLLQTKRIRRFFNDYLGFVDVVMGVILITFAVFFLSDIEWTQFNFNYR